MESESKKKNEINEIDVIIIVLMIIRLYLMLYRDNASIILYLVCSLFFIVAFMKFAFNKAEKSEDKSPLKDDILSSTNYINTLNKNKFLVASKTTAKPFQKYHTTTHNISFTFNQFTYTDRNETQSFQLASIHKIVLFGNNSQNQSLNIYYDKDKVYTFYSNIKNWKALLERLNAHFSLKIDAKTTNNKQVLYERKN
jgi:hypothetical protein